MENIKRTFYGPAFNKVTGKFHTLSELQKAGVNLSDNDVFAAMKLDIQKRREAHQEEYTKRLREFDENLREQKTNWHQKLAKKDRELINEDSQLRNKYNLADSKNQKLLLTTLAYEIYFSENGYTKEISEVKEFKETLTQKENSLKEDNKERFDKDWGFYGDYYKKVESLYKDDTNFTIAAATTSSNHWAALKLEKETKDLEAENDILNLLENTYKSLFETLGVDVIFGETLEEYKNKAKEVLAKKAKEKEALQSLKDEATRKEYEEKRKKDEKEKVRIEKEEKSRKFKFKVFLGLALVSILSIYNIVKPIKYSINNLVLFAPEYISQYAVTELLSGRNGYKEKYHESSLPGYHSVVYDTNYKDIIDNLKSSIPESDLTQVFKACETKAIDCSQGIPFTVLVSLAKKNNTLPELTQKINSLIGKDIGIGLNPHYEFKEGKRGLYNLQRSAF